MCAELYFHRQDVCMFQTPFLCGPEGFRGVWVEVKEEERLVCMRDDDYVCVCVHVDGELVVCEGVVVGVRWKVESTKRNKKSKRACEM